MTIFVSTSSPEGNFREAHRFVTSERSEVVLKSRSAKESKNG